MPARAAANRQGGIGAVPPRRPAAIATALALVLAAALSGCGDAGGGAALGEPVAGTSVVFDLDADLSDPARFYDLPYPSDARLDDGGHPDLRGFPFPAGNAIVASLLTAAARRPGFPVVGAAYFRFDGPLAGRAASDAIAAAADSPVLLVDVDPASASRGRLFPVVASTLEADAYAPEHLLAVAPFPGIVLAPHRRYAVVVRRSLGDAVGAPLGVPAAVASLRAGETPDGARGAALRDLLATVWPTLDELGVPRDDVAAATAFTTADVVADVATLSSAVQQRFAVDVEQLALDPDDGADHPRFCELHGRLRLPQFQAGTPPFNRDGLFRFDASGLPIAQREESVPIAITVPRRPMPAGGYPLTLYFHGSGGLSTQVVDRGRVSEPGGTPARGEGPSHVLAAHGFATAAAALPVNPERLPGAGTRAYLNFANLAAYPDTFRQATIEQRLFLDALERLRIPPEVLAGCAGPTLPAGEGAFRLRTRETSLLGQSLGAQIVNMVGAVEPRVGIAVPTGSGGLWSLVVLEAELLSGVPIEGAIPILLGTTSRVDHLHPGLQLVQAAFEPADPIVYAARLAHDPLPGHPVRPVFIPAGVDDPGFSNRIYAAMALATGTRQAGEVLSPEYQPALAQAGLAGIAAYPVADNVASTIGAPYTGVVVQVTADGILDAHHVFAQRDDVKYQYGCFLASFAATGRAVVPAPASLGTPCP